MAELEEVEFRDESSAFRAAKRLQREAEELLEEEDVRNAAEKAWGAVLNAARGAVLAKGLAKAEDLEVSTAVSRVLGEAVSHDLVDEYFRRMGKLHGTCFYNGVCVDVEADVRDTGEIIRGFEEEGRGP